MRKRVLVVDDNPGILSSLSAALSPRYEVTVAADAFTALRIMKAGPVDVVVLDVLMPALDGVAFTRVLRDQGFDHPIILMSASRSLETHAAGLPVAASIRKPFELADLEERIETALGKQA